MYINSSMFLKQNKTSLKAANNSTDETVVHPLPTLFRLLGLTPFKKVINFYVTYGHFFWNLSIWRCFQLVSFGLEVVMSLFLYFYNRQNLLPVTCTRESAPWTQRY